MQMALEVLSTKCGTPGGMMLHRHQSDVKVSSIHLQHVTFLQVYRLEAEVIHVNPIVDAIWVPLRPQ
jgi:hypothetical protein